MIIVQEIEKVSGSWNCWRIQMASRRWNRMSPKPKDFCSGCGMMSIRLFHGCFCAPHGFQAQRNMLSLRKSESSERESNSTWRIRCNSLDEPPSGCWFFSFRVIFTRLTSFCAGKSSLFMFVLASSSFVGRYSALVSKSSSYEQCKCM